MSEKYSSGTKTPKINKQTKDWAKVSFLQLIQVLNYYAVNFLIELEMQSRVSGTISSELFSVGILMRIRGGGGVSLVGT